VSAGRYHPFFNGPDWPHFLSKSLSSAMALVISSSDDDLELAVRHIKSGDLVAFPTETVYGLGARLSDLSLAKIFAVKRRPYTDPLICHFGTTAYAKEYVVLTDDESVLFDAMASQFWPGPLTIVAPARNSVPPLVMAGTGCVGVRVPSHPICHRFLELCGEPVAAPSANLFGHVSPTTAEHVQADLGSTAGLLIASGGAAMMGIESTVVKIQGNSIIILRPGFITIGQLERVAPGRVTPIGTQNEKMAPRCHEARHYALNIPTQLAIVSDDGHEIPSNAILIDFNRTFAAAASRVLRYFDWSPVGSLAEAISGVYVVLREAEGTQGAKLCLAADVLKSGMEGDAHDTELIASLRDRLLRSASHVIGAYKLN
jgi:tRNA threonylcarbamoyl adenosine modification protein (Sua5/YciO/YrdC/YwlC family)